MSLAEALFGMAAGIVASGALGVALSRSVVRAAVWLLVCLAGLALVYLLLGAEFLGAAQLMVYVGGTLVLVVFGVMLTQQGPFAGIAPRRIEWLIGGGAAFFLFASLVKLSLAFGRRELPAGADELPGVAPLGQALLGVPDQPGGRAYLLPFEIVSVHLLVVLLAAAYLARSKRKAGS